METIAIERLAALRRDLTEKRITIRKAEEELEESRLKAEDFAIKAAGDAGIKAFGTNEAAQKRGLALKVLEDQVYLANREWLHDLQGEADRLASEVEILIDQRRDYETRVRERQTDALAALGHSNGHNTDAAVDQIAGDKIVEAAVQAAVSMSGVESAEEDVDSLPF